MADIANLARHLLMTEVLQICESVHKQVEEQKLTVYQKGDVHTVVSSQTAPQEDPKDQSNAFTVTIQSDGQALVTQGAVAIAGEPLTFVAPPKEAYIEQQLAVVTQTIEGDQVHGVDAGQNETVALITHSGQVEPGETVTLISGSAEGMEGETMTVVTHSGQAGASESLAVVSACLAMEQPQVAEAFVINVDADKVNSSEVSMLASAATPPQEGTTELQQVKPPAKRKRGRPAKAKKEAEMDEFLPLDDEDPSADESPIDKQEMTSDDSSKRRLRQRSIAEGGYARLHMGLEDEEEGKKVSTPPRAATPKVHNCSFIITLVSCCVLSVKILSYECFCHRWGRGPGRGEDLQSSPWSLKWTKSLCQSLQLIPRPSLWRAAPLNSSAQRRLA